MASDRCLINAALRTAIRAVLEAHLNLTDHGFGVHDEQRIDETERQQRYLTSRASMLQDHSVEEFERACQYLEQLEVTRAPTSVFSTYNLKHAAERWHSHRGIEGRWKREYVSNGMLLVAAVHLGLQVRRASRTAFTGFLNVSARSVRSIEDQRKPPLPEIPDGDLFRPLGHLDGKLSYVAAGENRVITLRAAAHTPANLLRLAPADYWVSRFPSRNRRESFDTTAAVGHLFKSCYDVGFFDPQKFQNSR